MMQATRTLAGAIGFAVLAGLAAASTGDPAELPPDDFAGRQFVDSTGCVFIRAEIDGRVAWVPRLNRDREALCGFRPTFVDGGAVSVGSLPMVRPDAPPLADDAAPVRAAEAVAVATPSEPAPAPQPRTSAPRAAAAKAPVQAAARPSHVPNGYRPVWDDDRLNPHRGPRTARGDEMMNRVWTSDVPMRLR